MEIAGALEEWLGAIPEFSVDPNGTVTWSAGTIRGPRRLPIVFG
jgi:hypothetical protein